jgi:nucleotide-binding universal stress UspA family protein
MSIKDALLALTTYPEPTPLPAVEDAADLAAAMGAKLSAIACEVTIKAPRNLLADYLVDIPALVAAEAEKSAARAAELLAAFKRAARAKGVMQDVFSPRCLTSEAPQLLAEHARVRDLTIVPVPVGDFIDQWYAEDVIFGSGRPVIVLPETRTRPAPLRLDTVIVAWDFSRAAARAIADAVPILERATRVYVLTITDEKDIQPKVPGAELLSYLTRRGIPAEPSVVPADGRSIGDVLESEAATRKADLLVMGAYGHSRIREFVLGGATRSMLCRPPLPILLSH